MSEILARIDPSPTRRMLAIVVLAGIGVWLLYVTFDQPPQSPIAQFLLPLLGCVMLAQAFWNLRSTSSALVLRSDGLWIEGGERLFDTKDVIGVKSGFMEFKPSNGFAVIVGSPMKPRWSPGMYWTFGRRAGIGGATNPSQAKAMAEALKVLIEARKSA